MTVTPTPLVFSDLDRTLIYSAGALHLGEDDTLAPALVVSEIYQGKPLSFITESARGLLAEIAEAVPFVPTTTRTVAQYRRVQIPGPLPRYAITTNGGCILENGVRDVAWDASVRESVTAQSAPIDEIRAYLQQPLFEHWMLRLRDAEELFLYAIIEREELSAVVLNEISAWAGERGWNVSLQGRKLYTVPKPISKENAVQEVARRLGGGLVLAAGDSLLDQGMLLCADHSFRPAHGELHVENFQHENLQVTASCGVIAGFEIVQGFHDLVFSKHPVTAGYV